MLQRREQPHRSVFSRSIADLAAKPHRRGANAQVAVVSAEGLVGIEAVLGSRVAMRDAVVHIPGGTAGVAMSVDAFRCELDRRGALYDLAQTVRRQPGAASDRPFRSTSASPARAGGRQL